MQLRRELQPKYAAVQDPFPNKFNGFGTIEVKTLVLYKTLGLRGAIPMDSIEYDEDGQSTVKRRNDGSKSLWLVGTH